MPFLRSDEAPTQAEREKMPEHLFGDPENKKYPLDTDQHVKAAGSYVEKEHNAGRLGDAKYHEILARVNAAKKARGIGEEATKDDSHWERVERLDLASGEAVDYRKNPQGFGLVTRARLTRTGVFTYQTPNGPRRELRHPDEVFDGASLDSLAHATVTDDHPGKVNEDNWRQESIGHIAGRPGSAGQFVEGNVQIQHGPAVAKAQQGKLREVSCGYECSLEPTAGEYNGEAYDGIQRKIRYNHVALGPPGWGRAGPDVRMHLDSKCGVSGASEAVSTFASSMTDEEKAALEKAQKDAREATAALATARQDATNAKTAQEKADAKSREDAAKIAQLTADNELLKLQASRQTGPDPEQARADAKTQALIEETIQVRQDALVIFGADWKHGGKSIEQIKREAIAKMEPDFKLDAVLAPLQGLTGEAKDLAVRAVIDSTYATAKTHFDKVKAANDQLQRALTGTLDSGDDEEECEPDAEKSRKKMDADMRAASAKTPPRRDRRRAESASAAGSK